MHILLTDLLTCPRCGPDFGLIVLSDALADRRVREGWLGCPNCRTSYPIRDGVADLRSDRCAELERGSPLPSDSERPIRLAALLGVSRPRATVLVIEPAGLVATALPDLIPEVHVISASIEAVDGDRDPEERFLSRIVMGSCLPFRGSLDGVAVLGVDPLPLLPEVVRVLGRGSRLVVEGASPTLSEALVENGFLVHLEQDGVVVAGTPDHP